MSYPLGQSRAPGGCLSSSCVFPGIVFFIHFLHSFSSSVPGIGVLCSLVGDMAVSKSVLAACRRRRPQFLGGQKAHGRMAHKASAALHRASSQPLTLFTTALPTTGSIGPHFRHDKHQLVELSQCAEGPGCTCGHSVAPGSYVSSPGHTCRWRGNSETTS